ncbi:MAG TPA: family 1 glycosylhydrolase [Cellulomonas sp.]|uniref:family 1 glycosylhydrolase n=1 Tax=Cellulomonas sp. TaxID=40001 RepID=UPI002E326F40|nr:family 1 glycosylhydrolase [Cellulomonas sp.]HEX5333137.1 family 1 glycosylhydrolase [Cellulomonas sp.]
MMRNVVRSIGSTTMVGGSAFRSASGGRGDLVDAVCTQNRRPSTGLMSMRLTEDVGASATDQEWTRDPMNLYLDVDFAAKFKKDHFFFGVANAPYLCEGGYNTPEGPKNSYGYFEADGSVPVSGEATRFWDNFTQHVDLAASLGLTAFRMGVDWSRVQPTLDLKPGAAPAWDPAALDRYAAIISRVQDKGMEPIITLHHFAHPAWLGKTLWLRDEAADLVTAYELRIVDELGSRLVADGKVPIGHFITFNELNLVPLIYFGRMMGFSDVDAGPGSYQAAYDNVVSAHVRIYDGIKDLYEERGWPEPQVGFGTASKSAYELDKLFLDMVRLRSWGIAQDDVAAFLEERRTAWDERLSGLARRQLPDDQFAYYQNDVGAIRQYVDGATLAKTLAALYTSKRLKKLDYISANVYEPFGEARCLGNQLEGPKWWEFTVDGDIYRTMIWAYNEANTDLPMYMGENSIAYEQPRSGRAVERPDGWTRERYLKTYLMEMVRCVAEGVPIRGYLYWSLVDDFEWQAGFPPRLGLYNYDYVSHQIQETDGRGEPAGEIYASLISALQSGDKQTVRDAFVISYAARRR